MTVPSNELSLVPKLKREHIYFSSFSRMRVDLAVQVSIIHNKAHLYKWYIFCDFTSSSVLSKSVSDTFAYFGDPNTKETVKSYTLTNFFDCLNIRSLNEWIQKQKPDLKPYTSVDDPRSKVQKLKCTLLRHYVWNWLIVVRQGVS